MGKEKVRAKATITIPESGKLQFEFLGDWNTNWARLVGAKFLREYRNYKQRGLNNGRSDSESK